MWPKASSSVIILLKTITIGIILETSDSDSDDHK